MPDKTRTDYEKKFGRELTERFYQCVEELNDFLEELGWVPQECNFNTYWYSVRFSKKRVAFGIGLDNPDTLYVYFKDVKAEASDFLRSQFIRYHPVHNQAEYRILPKSGWIEAFIPLLKLSYERTRSPS